MRFSFSSLALAGALLALPCAAQAQGIENGQEVRVNPLPPGRASVLLYPGGEYRRSVPRLLYPGERNGPISLHMPTHKRVARSEAESTPAKPRSKPKPQRVASAAPKPVPAPKVAAASKPAPAPKAAQAAPPQAAPLPGIFGGPDYSNVFGNQAPAPTQPQRQASNAPPPRTAPAGPTNGNENLTKRSVILFAKDAPDPAAGALGAIKFLASDLNAAMTAPNARVELQAFGGVKGDKGSDARRLSLKRALAIRQVLIDDGVSPDRIDVRAMGGADDSGPADRVDVYIKA